MVDESYDCFPTLGHHECWPRVLTIISDKSRFAQIGIDLDFERFDIDFIVIYGQPGRRTGVSSAQLISDCELRTLSNKTRLFGTLILGMGNATWKI